MSHLFRDQGIIRENILEVIPNVYQMTFRGVNVLVIAEAELTIIDTGFRVSVPRIIDFVRSLGRSPEKSVSSSSPTTTSTTPAGWVS